MEQEDGLMTTKTVVSSFTIVIFILIFTYSWESVAHWVFSPGHPLLLLGQQVILPHLQRMKITSQRRMRFSVLSFFYIESVEEVSVVEESVGEEKVEEHDEQVENFAEDEPAEIYVVPQSKQ